MNSNIIRSWNGRTIRQREDGYLSFTDMAQACGKRYADWSRLDSTKEYLEALRERRYADVHNESLVEITQGGIPENQGTWGYRKVALRFAQWLSPDFAIQVDDWIEELLTTGKVELNQEESKPIPKVLSSEEKAIAITNFMGTLEKLGVNLNNPRINQELQDFALNIHISPALHTVKIPFMGTM